MGQLGAQFTNHGVYHIKWGFNILMCFYVIKCCLSRSPSVFLSVQAFVLFTTLFHKIMNLQKISNAWIDHRTEFTSGQATSYSLICSLRSKGRKNRMSRSPSSHFTWRWKNCAPKTFHSAVGFLSWIHSYPLHVSAHTLAPHIFCHYIHLRPLTEDGINSQLHQNCIFNLAARSITV